MTNSHIPEDELARRLADAEAVVSVGATYQHYKSPDMLYKVLSIGITEADETPCVIYQALYGAQLTFVRPVSVWLETVDWDGHTVPRFRRI